jgi:putative oxidoreductase
MDASQPKLAAIASGVAEFGGGLGILLGLATPVAAAAAGFNMWVAVRRAHWPKGLYGPGGHEFALLLGTAAVAIGIIGPGALSLDALRGRGRG